MNCPSKVSMSKSLKAISGFTLVELIVTIAVLAIIAAMAVPSMSEALANQRIRSVAATLDNALNAAKTESLIRKQNIKVTISADGKSIKVEPLKPNGAVDSDNTIAKYTINNHTKIMPKTNITFTPNRHITAACYNITDGSGSARQVNVDAVANISIQASGSC